MQQQSHRSAAPVLRSLLPVACAVAVLVACGGGDDDVAPTPDTAVVVPAGTLSSLGADGWAAVTPEGTAFAVTGGDGALAADVHIVENRNQLLAALYGAAVTDTLAQAPVDRKKLIYVKGRIDLNVADDLTAMTQEAYMAQCGAAVTSYTSFAAFDAAYKAAYDPSLWIKQSLEDDSRPPRPQPAAAEASGWPAPRRWSPRAPTWPSSRAIRRRWTSSRRSCGCCQATARCWASPPTRRASARCRA